ncbi:MAG: hypothetical protein WD607_07180 [Candidatus Paceibacterota bacterium]
MIINNKKTLIILSLFIPIISLFGFLTVNAQVAMPTDFTVEVGSSCAFILEWNGETDLYDIERIFDLENEFGTSETNIEPDENSDNGKYQFIDGHLFDYWGDPSEDIIDPGTEYGYRVRAFDENAGQYSDPTEILSTTTNGLPSKPGKPTGLESQTSANGEVIEIKWSPVSSVSSLFEEYGGFKILVSKSSDGGENYSEAELVERVANDGAGMDDGKYFYDHDVDDTGKDVSYQYTLYTQEVGGLSCDYNRDEHVVLSDPSDLLTVPVRPGNFNVEFSESPRQMELSWVDRQNPPFNETTFQIQRSLQSNFSSGITITATSDSTSYNDKNIVETGSQTYHYRIRSCIDDNCSFWSQVVSVTTGIQVPENLEARILYATTTYANNLLSWDENPIESGTNLIIERATSSDYEVIANLSHLDPNRQNRNYLDSNIELGEEYFYKARIEQDGNYSAYSNIVSADLQLAYIFYGLGWSSSQTPSANISLPASMDYAGPGWFKLNSGADGGSGQDSYDYSIIVNKQNDNTGNVLGTAWSDAFGWLSFYPEDVEGCPGAGSACDATMNLNTGELSGWARFIEAKEAYEEGNNTFNWDGWVRLSGSDYGVELDLENVDSETKTVPISGQAWGGPMTGWLDFASRYCEQDTCTSRALFLGDPPEVYAGDSHELIQNREHTHGDDEEYKSCIQEEIHSGIAWATDPDDDLDNYKWEFISCVDEDNNDLESCPAIAEGTESGEISGGLEQVEIPGPTYTPTQTGEYTLQLTVEDFFGNEAVDTVIDSVINIEPNVYAGLPHNMRANVTHDHTESYSDGGAWAIDENGDLISYQWTWATNGCVDYQGSVIDCPGFSAGTDSGTLEGNACEEIEIPGPRYTPLTGGREYRIVVTVEDDYGNTDFDTALEIVPQCADAADNEGDGLTDLADPDCENYLDDDESVEGFDEFEFIFEER